jgi:hypothetical protein
MAGLVYDGTVWRVQAASGRAVVTQNTTLYVNGTLGDDANDGTANTAGFALATLQRAVDIAFGYEPGRYTIAIQIGDAGTYAPCVTPAFPGTPIMLVGGDSFPTVESTLGHCVMSQGQNTVTCDKIAVKSTGLSSSGFVALNGGTLNTRNTLSREVGGGVFQAFGGGIVNIQDNHDFNGDCRYAFWALNGGLINIASNMTFSINVPITVTYFALASSLSNIFFNITPGAAFASAGVSGQRYQARSNSIISTQGAGVSYLPGDVGGAVETGGQYT